MPSEVKFLILASASPRRAELLMQAGFELITAPASADERRLEGEIPLQYAARLAREKAKAAQSFWPHPASLILGADTVVFIGDRIFGKPLDLEEAAAHLRALSGQTHQVVTAFCLMAPNGEVKTLETVVSDVSFRDLSEGDIEAYTATGDGLDKAGGYGIQSGGAFMVDKISGSYTNIVGLPLAEVIRAYSAAALDAPNGKD